MKKDPELEAMKNEQLEFLSDQIRKGIPVGMLEAIAVIEYQTRLRREREYNSMFNRAKRWIKRILGAQKP